MNTTVMKTKTNLKTLVACAAMIFLCFFSQKANAQSTAWTETFDSWPPDGWTITPDPGWRAASAVGWTHRTLETAYAPMGNPGNFYLITPEMIVPNGAVGATFSFRFQAIGAGGYSSPEYVYLYEASPTIRISRNSTETEDFTQTILRFTDRNPQANDFHITSGEWYTVEISLDAYADGQPLYIAIHQPGGNLGCPIFIDDVSFNPGFAIPSGYHTGDFQVISNMVTNNGLPVNINSSNPVSDWFPLVQWDNSTPRRVTSMSSWDNQANGTYGVISLVGLSSLNEVVLIQTCNNGGSSGIMTGIDITGLPDMYMWIQAVVNNAVFVEDPSNKGQYVYTFPYAISTDGTIETDPANRGATFTTGTNSTMRVIEKRNEWIAFIPMIPASKNQYLQIDFRNITYEDAPTPPVISAAEPPEGFVGVPYSYQFEASGGIPSTTTWSVVSGFGNLPDGLELSSSGLLSGTPTTASPYPFILRASNGVSPDPTGNYMININPVVAPAITTTELPKAMVNVAYNHTVSATGTAPITWSFDNLPSELSGELFINGNTGVLSGTIYTAGTYQVTVVASNMSGTPATRTFTLTVDPYSEFCPSAVANINRLIKDNNLDATLDAPSTWNFATFTGSPIPRQLTGLMLMNRSLTGEAYFEDLPRLEYLYIQNNQLTGLHISNCSVIEFLNCSSNRLSSLDITAVGNAGWGEYGLTLDNQRVDVTLTEEEGVEGTYTLEIPLNNPRFIGWGTWWDWCEQNSSCHGDISYSSGVLQSTNNATENAHFEVDVVKPSHVPGVIRIRGDIYFTYIDALQPPTITTTQVRTGVAQVPYEQTLVASGADPITWALHESSLPNNLSLSTEGVISGTPTEEGEFTFTVRATNQKGHQDKAYTLKIFPEGTLYDPIAVDVINALIQNNGLDKTPATSYAEIPSDWNIANWDEGTPKQLIGFTSGSYQYPMYGVASFAGLSALRSLRLQDNALTGLDLRGVDVENWTEGAFQGGDQSMWLKLARMQAADPFTVEIPFGAQPTFGNTAFSYNMATGILSSTDEYQTSVSYNVPVIVDLHVTKDLSLSGWINISSYSKIDEYDPIAVAKINALFDNNDDNKALSKVVDWQGIPITKNDPEGWEGAYLVEWDYESPRRLRRFGPVNEWETLPQSVGISDDEPFLTGEVDFSGITFTTEDEGAKVNFSGTSITALNVSGNTNLTEVICQWNDFYGTGSTSNLTSVNVTNNNDLKGIRITDHENLTTLDLAGCNSLEYVLAHGNSLTTVSNLTAVRTTLKHLRLQNNNLTTLSLQNFPLLETLSVAENLLTSLTLSSCPELQYLHCHENKLSALDLTGIYLYEGYDPGWEYMYGSFSGWGQQVDLTLAETLPNVYTFAIDLNDVSFSAYGEYDCEYANCTWYGGEIGEFCYLTYTGGILSSKIHPTTDELLPCMGFEVVTNSMQDHKLKGTMILTYTDDPILPVITTTTLPDGKIDVVYNATLEATTNKIPTWSIADGGNLPAGLSLNPATGVISGTPILPAGLYEFTVEATNAAGTATEDLSIFIESVDVPVITTTELPEGMQGVYYEYTLEATSTVEVTWAVHSGSLPPGLELDPETGVISGTPTTINTYTFEVVAANVGGNSQPQELSIEIEAITYCPDAVAAVNTLIQDHGLSWAYDSPGSWSSTYVTWNTNKPRELIRLDVSFQNITGHITAFAGLTTLESFQIRQNNGILSVDVSGCTALQALNIQDGLPNLVSLNASGCVALDRMYWEGAVETGLTFGSHTSLTTLDLSDCSALQTLTIGTTGTIIPLSTLNLSGCTALKTLNHRGSSLSQLNLSALPNLETLEVRRSNIATLSINGLAKLSRIDIYNNDLLTEVTVSNLTAPVQCTLNCQNNDNLTKLTVTNLPNFEIIDAQNNALTELIASNLPQLYRLSCQNNELVSLDMREVGSTKNWYLYCQYNRLTSLNLTGVSTLSSIHCNNNRLTALDLSSLNLSALHDEYSRINDQSPEIDLFEDLDNQGTFTAHLTLNSPEQLATGISYASGVLSSTDRDVTTSPFSVVVGTPAFVSGRMSGTLHFTYYSDAVPPTITTPATLTAGGVGMTYQATLAANGTEPITWDVASGSSLPNGLTIEASTGIISGIPTVADNYSFTIEASNTAGTDTRTFSLLIRDCDIAVTPATPWVENFENPTFPAQCWSHIDFAGSYNWQRQAYVGYGTESAAAYHGVNMENNSPTTDIPQESWLITPPIELPTQGEYVLEFWSRVSQYGTHTSNASVYVSTTTNEKDAFVAVLSDVITVSGSGTSWRRVTVPLANYVGETVFIAFQYASTHQANSAFQWWIDDVTVREKPMELLSVTPDYDATNIPITPTVQARFSTEIQAVSSLTNLVTFGDVQVTPTINGDVLNIPVPAPGYLNYNTAYTIEIPANAIQDIRGFSTYEEPIVWTFTTRELPTATEIVGVEPLANARNVPLNTPIRLTFNRPDVTISNWTGITIGGVAITAVPTVDGFTMTIPHNGLEYNTTYTVTIPANSIDGVPYDHSWQFTTTCALLTEFPFIETFNILDHDGVPPAFPLSCWDIFSTKGDANWFYTSADLGRAEHLYLASGVGENESWMVTPKFKLPASGRFVLEFESAIDRPNFYANGSTSSIYVSKGAPNPELGDFEPVYTLSGTDVDDSYQLLSIPLDDYLGEEIYLAFRYYTPGVANSHGWWVREVFVYDLDDIDVSVDSLVRPWSNINLHDEEEIRVWVTNRGTRPIPATDLTFELWINGEHKATEPYINTGNPNKTDIQRLTTDLYQRVFRFDHPADLAATNDYEITVKAVLANDRDLDNNTHTATVTNKTLDLPWIDRFGEAFPPPRWDTVRNNLNGRSWKTVEGIEYRDHHAECSEGLIETASDAWLITTPIRIPQRDGRAGQYLLEFISTVNSAHLTTETYAVYASTLNSTDTNDFEQIFLVAGDGIGNNEIDRWQTFSIGLDQFSGEDVRFAFVVKGRGNGRWRIDNVTVFDVDAELAAIINPTTAENLTAVEEVKVLIKNNGGRPLSDFRLKLDHNGVEQAIESYSGTIPAKGEVEYTFTATVDLSANQAHLIKVSILDVEGDGFPANDTLNKRVITAPVGTLVNLYGYKAYGSGSAPLDFVKFTNYDPESVTAIEHNYIFADGANMMLSGEYVNGFYYGYTMEMQPLGGRLVNFVKVAMLEEPWVDVLAMPITTDPATDMTYCHETRTMYAINGNSLGIVDMETGAIMLANTFNRWLFAIAADLDGTLYVIDEYANLCKVNKNPYALEILFNTNAGPAPEYTQSMAFDHHSGTLFWAKQDMYMGGLFEIDIEAQTSIRRGTVGGGNGDQIVGMYVPYIAPVEIVQLHPEDEAEDVSITATIMVEFNMDITAVDLSGITLNDEPATAVVNRHVLIINNPGLDYDTEYTVHVPGGTIEDYAADIEWTFHTELPPITVTSVTPEDEAIDVALDAEIAVIFSRNITGTAEGVTLNGIDVSASIEDNKLVVSSTLNYGILYEVFVPVTAIDGYSGDDIEWTFTTMLRPVEITSLTPADDATDVALDATISVLFNQGVTGTPDGITLNGEPVTASLVAPRDAYNTLLIEHDGLEYATTYTVLVPAGVIDRYEEPIEWSFTTLPVPIAVEFTTPLHEATDVEITTEISVTFNQDITGSMAGITINGNDVSASAGITDNKLTLSHGVLSYNTLYTVRIPVGAIDDYAQIIEWSFTTEIEPLALVSTEPEGIDVEINAPVRVTFSRAISLLSQDDITVNGNPTAASANGSVLTLTHGDFAFDTEYTVYIPVGTIADYADPITWTFTTRVAPTVIGVVNTVPTDDATNVAINTAIQVLFDMPVTAAADILDKITIDNGITVTNATTVGSILTIVYDGELAYATTYTVEMDAGAIEGYDEIVTWSFTTRNEPVTLLSTVPESGATSVPITSSLTATFSKAVTSSNSLAGITVNGFPATATIDGAVVTISHGQFAYSTSTGVGIPP
ncbi:MAG: Ig-like domain-containing protein, partial [Bacteroidales bacterium]|nr:Ig-like domain-containing protein [Bacteroidales bacterium]